MFKKAKRSNLRRRNESDEDEKEESQPAQPPCGPLAEDNPMLDAPSTDIFSGVSMDVHHGNGFQSKAIKKEKKTRDAGGAPKASLLSFDDDEDEAEVFRVKKSNHSKKIVKQLKKEYKEDLEKVCYVKQEPNTVPKELPDEQSVELFKRGASQQSSSEQGEERWEVDSTDEQEPKTHSQSLTSKTPTTTAAGAFSNPAPCPLSNLRPVRWKCGEIPDAAFIHAARKRRQMARELGGDAPLVETDTPKKRLVREEEEEGDGSDDEDEDEKRISFSGVKNKSQRTRIAEEIDTTSVFRPTVNQASWVNFTALTLSLSCLSVGSDPLNSPGLSRVSFFSRLSQMRVGHDANAKRYDQIQEELEAAQNAIHRLEGSSNDDAEQYKFLQEMRGYVRDLLECFGEKVPTVAELEGNMHQLLRQRACRLVQRRQDDIKDESAEFASLSSKAVMAPNLMSLDSFGRDRTVYQEHARQRRIAEREARRTRRRQAREQNGKRAEHLEGLSSDDEETSTDLTSYCLERGTF
ncbi:PAX3- and PAX7-binding protein 1 [Salvelinus sp. IW2-2015]|uniref:PAX3- and PAX7-binding protein 1 n=1 Tax=Salvelinus sp. IW2-2015 TaxID=2691554 RepID=UPI0038D4C41F